MRIGREKSSTLRDTRTCMRSDSYAYAVYVHVMELPLITICIVILTNNASTCQQSKKREKILRGGGEKIQSEITKIGGKRNDGEMCAGVSRDIIIIACEFVFAFYPCAMMKIKIERVAHSCQKVARREEAREEISVCMYILTRR